MHFVRVLVVEDEPRMRELLERGLKEEGYSVDTAGDGPTGLWMALENDYCAIVLDLMLPLMDGVAVCERLRAGGRWAPVIMLTARAEMDDRIRGLDAGADDYLAKPFGFAELAARLRALVRRGSSERPTVLKAGTLTVDPARRVAWRGSSKLDLSAKEFALLEMFVRHPGEVLSRTRILEQVWDFAYSRTSNVVDQYVTYLRRKVDRPFGVAEIETVRGAGYRLKSELHESPLPVGIDRLPNGKSESNRSGEIGDDRDEPMDCGYKSRE